MGHGSLIWCSPKQAPFNQLDLLPINYSTNLLHTIFVDEYLTERLHQFVDNLNLLYVALTRAEESLVIMAETPSKTGGLKNVSHVLYRLLNELNMTTLVDESTKVALMNAWSNEEQTFEYGNVPEKEQRIFTEATNLVNFKTTELGNRIKIHPESEAMSSPESLKHLKHGKLMHRLFELIITADDVDTAIMRLILNGQLKTSDRDSVSRFIHSKIAQEQVIDWFNPENKIINEGTIMVPAGTYRPDRVILSGDKVIVVDYKFGELKQEKHLQQVRRYMDLLSQMKYTQIEGYLWYLREEDEIICVNENAVQGTLF